VNASESPIGQVWASERRGWVCHGSHPAGKAATLARKLLERHRRVRIWQRPVFGGGEPVCFLDLISRKEGGKIASIRSVYGEHCEKWRRLNEAADAAVRAELVAMVREHGPSTLFEFVTYTGMPKSRVKQLLPEIKELVKKGRGASARWSIPELEEGK